MIIVDIIVVFLCLTFAYCEVRSLQMNGYKMQWCFSDTSQTLYKYSFICAISAISFFLAILNYAALTTFMSFSALLAAMYYFVKSMNQRTKLKLTKRALRLLTIIIVATVGLQAIITIFIKNIFLHTVIECAYVTIYVAIVKLLALALAPLEKRNNSRYIKKAAQKIASLNAVRIAITGSYGKTSCKNILYEMLKNKFITVKTAKNYNTPIGIALSAESLRGDEEIFIAEMGARRIGEIAELARIILPTIAIITGVGNQHLDTFKTEENIYKTKKELLDALPDDGFCVLNGENSYCERMATTTKVDTVLVNLHQNTGVYARNIKLSNSGSSFTISGLNEDLDVTTRLLGKHNIINILLSATVANYLGVSHSELANAIKQLKPTPHRLELVENTRNITIIDDSYNCNAEGARFALEVLTLFNGRKVVFTQGIVELGAKAEEVNTTLGALISNVADVVILVGINTAALEKGLVTSCFPLSQIHKFDSLQMAQDAFKDILEVGDILLIQNDIP